MGIAVKFILTPFTAVPTRFWGNFLLASVIAMSLEIAAEKFVEVDRTPSITQYIFNMTGLYQRIVASPRNPFPRYTAIVSIDPSKEKHSIPSSHSVCQQREFLARLIERIAIASPDVIVIDKDFLPDECNKDERDKIASQLLITTMQRVSQTIPLVVGRTLRESSWSL